MARDSILSIAGIRWVVMGIFEMYDNLFMIETT